MTTRSKTTSRRNPCRSSAVVFPPRSERSMTALAVDALRSGVLAARPQRPPSIPHESEILCGDPDDTRLANEYVGDETPGGSTPTPDQNDVDEIGRVYGVQEEDSGELRTSAEILARRDHYRAELRLPSRRRSPR